MLLCCRYHLQAFRHLYVLAVEPRLLVPRDIDTGHMCYVHLTVVYLDTAHYTGQQVRLRAPCILPELSKLQEVGTILFGQGKYWWHIWDFVCSKMGTTSPIHFYFMWFMHRIFIWFFQFSLKFVTTFKWKLCKTDVLTVMTMKIWRCNTT